jgi:HEAT repeat protein
MQFLTLAALLLVAAPSARPDDAPEPVLRGKTLTEWLDLLRQDKEYRSRLAGLIAAEAIGPLQSNKVVPAVVVALRDDTDERLRRAAAQALGRMGEKIAARTSEERIPFTTARDALSASMRTDPAGPVRAAAAAALGKIGKGEASVAVSDLAGALKDAFPEARAAAADTLRRLGPDARDATAALTEAAGNRILDKPTRIQAVLALGNIGDPALSAVPVLATTLEDAEAPTDLRKAAAETLGRLGKGAVATTGKLAAVMTAKASPVELRRAAAGTLDQFGPAAAAALPALRQALRDDDSFVRSLSLHAIGRLPKAVAEQRKPVVDDLLALIGTERVIEVAVAALETLGDLGPDSLGSEAARVLARLNDLRSDGRKAVREAARAAATKFAPAAIAP